MRDVFVYSRYAPRQKGGLRAIRCFLSDINPAEIGLLYLTLNTFETLKRFKISLSNEDNGYN
jgi:hypothetical protein